MDGFEQSLSPILYWTSFLGVTPFYNRKKREFKGYIVYAIFKAPLVCAAILYDIVYRLLNRDKDVHVEALEGALRVVYTCIMFFGVSYYYSSKLTQLFGFLRDSGSIVGKYTFLAVNAALIIWCSTTVFLEKPSPVKLSSFIRSLYVYNLLLFQVVLLLGLHDSAKSVNLKLESVFKERNYNEEFLLLSLGNVTEQHNLLVDAVDNFNRIFGWELFVKLFLYSVHVLNMATSKVECCNYYDLVYVIGVFVLLITLLVISEHIKDELEQCVGLSNKISLRYASSKYVSSYIQVLTNQVTSRRPKISAAGVVDMDYPMMVTFVNIVATYIIVVYQFKYNNNFSK